MRGELKPRGPIRKWIRRVVLTLLLVVVLAVSAVLILLHTAWGREQVRREVEKGLAGAFPGGAKLGKFEGSIFTELIVRDVELDAPDGKPMVTVGELRIDVSLWQLLKRNVRVKHIAATKVRVSIRPQAASATPPEPPPDALAPPPEPGAWSIDVQALEVHDAIVAIDTGSQTFTFDGIEIAGAVALPAREPVRASGSLTATWRERNAPITAAATLAIGNGIIQVPLATLVVGGANTVSVSAYDAIVDGAFSHGTVTVAAPQAAIAQLVPGVELPGDAALTIDAGPVGGGTQLEVFGVLGSSAHLRGSLRADLAKQRLSGALAATGLDFGALTNGRVVGQGSVSAIVAGSPKSQRLLLMPHVEVLGVPPSDATIAVELKPQKNGGTVATALVAVTGEGGARVAANAVIRRTIGAPFELEDGKLDAAASDLAAATGGLVPVTGDVHATLDAKGPFGPGAKRTLTAHGSASGVDVRTGKLRVGIASANFDVELTDKDPLAHANIDAEHVSNAGSPLGRANADVALRRDRKLSVTATVWPKAAAVVIDTDALVTLGSTIDVALGLHSVRAIATGELWAGTGGHVTISPTAIAVRGVTATNGVGSIAVGADVTRATGALKASVDALGMPAKMIDPHYKGIATAQLKIERDRRGRWSGGGTVAAKGFAPAADAPPLDATATVALAGRRVDLDAQVVHTAIGTVELQVGLDGPNDPTDAAAWFRVERKDVHTATLTLKKIDGSALGAAGTIDGVVRLGAAETHGSLAIRNVATKVGPVDADVTISPSDRDGLVASATAKLEGVGDASIVASFQLPVHVLDPAAWWTLGRGALLAASAEVDDIGVDAALLARFGIASEYRGKATVQVAVGPGGQSARVDVDAKDVRGGTLAKPLAAHVDVTVDGAGTRANATASVAGGAQLVEASAQLPMTLARWTLAPRSGLVAPLTGTLLLGSHAQPTLAARDLLAVVGRSDIARGTITGQGAAHGTLGAPLGELQLDVKDIAVAARYSGKPTPSLTAMHVSAAWGGAAGTVDISGSESNGGTLDLHVAGSPAAVALATGRIAAAKLDLAPVAVFLPGPLVATEGTLDAAFSFNGPANLAGMFKITRGRLALSPTIGTLRNATVDARVEHQTLTATVTGALGSGKIVARATGTPTSIEATATLTKIQPIGALQPIIDADVTAKLALVGSTWRGKLAVEHGVVAIPSQSGHELLAASPPADFVFLDAGTATVIRSHAALAPWLVLDVALGSTRVDGDDLGDAVAIHAVASGNLTLSYGDTLGLDGQIGVERADVDLFGRRYEVETGPSLVSFDGTTDPLLDIHLVHEFPELTLMAGIGGRASKPDLSFSSQPGTYTEAQLLGFFLGGTPGGDTSSATRDAIAGAGSSLLSNKVARVLQKQLPFKLVDTFACEPATSSTSTSCTAGRWIAHKVYIAAQTRIDARPDENTNQIDLTLHFWKRMTIDASGGDKNYDGLDFLWRWRW